MKNLKISIDASKFVRNLIYAIDRIFDYGFKAIYGEFETIPLKGRECGEALDPNTPVVRVQDDGSAIPGQCHVIESVITRPPNLDSSIPISPEPRSCSSSGYCSDESSIRDEVFTDTDVDDPFPELSSEADLLHNSVSPTVASISKTNLTTAMEEAENDIHAKTNGLMTVIDVVDATQFCNEELAKIKEQLEVSNAELRRLNAAKDSFQAKELELLERQVVAQEAIATFNAYQAQKEADSKRNDALVEAKAKANSVLFYVEELGKVVNETSDWKNASDYTVKKAMRNIDEWKEEMYKIIETEREFKMLVEKNGFTEDYVIKKDRVEREVDDLKADMDAAILLVENEDNFRALYTLDTTPVRDPVKLPKFSGKDGEYIHVFKEEMNRGFVQNRIPRANQLSKLRES